MVLPAFPYSLFVSSPFRIKMFMTAPTCLCSWLLPQCLATLAPSIGVAPLDISHPLFHSLPPLGYILFVSQVHDITAQCGFIRGESLSLVHPCLFVRQSVSQLVPLSRLSQRGAFASPPSWMGLLSQLLYKNLSGISFRCGDFAPCTTMGLPLPYRFVHFHPSLVEILYHFPHLL